MGKIQNFLLGFFLLTTVGLTAFVIKQQVTIAKLRSGDSLADTERAALQKKILEAQKRQHDLEDQLATAQAKSNGKKTADAEADADSSDPTQNPSIDQRQRGPGNRLNNFTALMNNPEFVKLLNARQKGALDSSYAGLFKQLGLTPAQLDQFKNLLVEKQSAARDVLTAAREQGLDFRTDRDAVKQLLDQANAEIDNNIRSTLGDSAYAQYKNYEQTLPQRNIVNQLQQSLSYTSAPLTDDQANQLIQILANNASSSNANSMRMIFGPQGVTFGGQQSKITDQTIAQAQGVLSPAQIDALKQLQQQQQAQAKIRSLIRTQRTSTQTGAAGSSGAR
ncbi:MAG: hypothetical protein KGJ37_05655 [Verrucomicrobiota bacterium]|nr:hypothetical protein [Verrucomicrobiota bacterium]